MDENNCNKEVGITVTGFTEFTWNKITYRANLCYKQDIAWFDWVLVAWAIPSDTKCDIIEDPTYPNVIDLPMEQIKSKKKEKAMLVPAKLITFIETDNNETYALIHSCWQYRKKVSVITYQ